MSKRGMQEFIGRHPKATGVLLVGALVISAAAAAKGIYNGPEDTSRTTVAEKIDGALCRNLLFDAGKVVFRTTPEVINPTSANSKDNSIRPFGGGGWFGEPPKVGVRMPYTASKYPGWVALVPESEVDGDMGFKDVSNQIAWVQYDYKNPKHGTNGAGVAEFADSKGHVIQPQECAKFSQDAYGRFSLSLVQHGPHSGEVSKDGRYINPGIFGLGVSADMDAVDFYQKMLAGVPAQ